MCRPNERLQSAVTVNRAIIDSPFTPAMSRESQKSYGVMLALTQRCVDSGGSRQQQPALYLLDA